MKKTLSFIYMLLACAVMVSGITLAYFSDKTELNTICFTTGTVKVEVELSDGDWSDWKQGNDKTITWYFTNTGTLDATLDVEIKKGWNTNTIKENVLYEVYKEFSMVPAEPQVTWTLKNSEDWELISVDVYRYKTAVAPEETVHITFILSIDNIPEEYKSAEYDITLLVTATQVIDE